MLSTDWTKAKASSDSNGCLEARRTPEGGVEIRDSKLGDESPRLKYTPHEWTSFIDGATNGEFDL